MGKWTCMLAGCAALISMPSFGAELPVIVKIPRLTLEAAQRIAQVAVDNLPQGGHPDRRKRGGSQR